ncbi:MAG: InlB B-repeat-containing protein, partial [Lachnospiraceae bacterium]|nr:InlB B-repeat-containing protein [Lachnospiraceae bacterium]
MRRKHKRILGVLLACLMCCVPAAQVMAATSYGVSEEAVAKVLFPGDSLTGMTAGTTVITENGETTTVEGDTWTNSSDSAKAYKVSSYTAETIETVTAEDGTETTATTAPASVTLETAGYVLTVVNGTSKTAQQEGGSTDNHYTFTDEEKAALENENTSKDIAYYKSGESVTITAAEAPEGYEFAGWSTDADGVTFADAASMETTITMPEKQVTITATYQEKVEETQAAEVADEAAADAAAVDSADTGAAEDTGESADQTVADGSDAGTGEGSGEDTNAVSSEDLLVVIEDSYNSEEGTSTDAGSSDTVENTASAAYSLTVNYDAGADSYLKTDTFSYTAGEIVTLSAESMEGYIFSYWFVSTMNIALDDTETETITFTMPEANVEILAEYAAVVAETQASEEDTNGESSEETTENPDAAVAVAEYDSNNGIMIIYGEDEDTDSQNTTASYTLTINYAADSGSISDSVNNTYEEGTTVPLDIKTIDGYTFSSWSESNDITITQAEDGSYSITMLGADVTITANYTQAETEAAKYSVTVDGVDAGSYAAGETVTVAQPDASTGQVFSSWQITNNASITLTDAGDGTWTFTMPDSEVALASAFDAATYTVTVVNGTTGSGETSGTFAYGSTVSIAAGTAEDGKTFSNWTSTGSTEVAFENASSATTTFTMPAGDVEVTAYYTNLPNTYTVKVSNGLINGTYTEHTYEEGTTITITASAGTNGQEFSGWTVTEGSYDLGSSASSSSITVTVNQDLAFAANYSGVKYNVTVTNGTADYTSCTAGTSVTITAAEPEAGYAFDYWTVDTANTMLASSTRQTTTFTMPSADVTVTAVYKQVKYTV